MTGYAPAHERLSETGLLNRALGAAWAGYYADRALLLWTFVWLLIRLRFRLMQAGAPAAVYEPVAWPAQLLFPEAPDGAVWYALAAVVAGATGVCLLRPRLVPARVMLAVGVVVLIAPEFSWKIYHINHLFLLAHVYALFLPVARPEAATAAEQAAAMTWYRAGLLFPYTMAGLWKFVDMTIRHALKPGMTWLHPDAMVVTSVVEYRTRDLPLDVARTLDGLGWAFPVGYVLLAFVFAAAALAAWRRPLIALVLPTILAFHLSNVYTIYVWFVSTCLVALLLLLPYDRLNPALRRRLRPAEAHFVGRGAEARYRRLYANGDEDVFDGFYAYRACLVDRSWLLAAPLYYPGVAWAATRLLGRRYEPQQSGT